MPLGFPPAEVSTISATFEPVTFEALPDWQADNHSDALRAFLSSARQVIQGIAKQGDKASDRERALAHLCKLALETGQLDRDAARALFETHFTPHRMVHNGAAGLLTGYYEPELESSLTKTERFSIPVYRRPPDLINLVSDAARGAAGSNFTHMRQTADGLEPFATREEIENGALHGKGLELLWLDNAVDCFFLHIQGSGLIRLPDGTQLRITYDGKNGYPYTSVGRYLIDQGHFTFDQMSLETMKAWLNADAVRGRNAMWQNKSFVFFRVLEGEEAKSAMGVQHIPLTEGRSLAVDSTFHQVGMPIYVTAPSLTHAMGPTGFHRLMIAQDAGSAIRGPERGDLYFGSGAEAGRLAGITKHPGNFFVLLPKDRAAVP